MPDSVYGSGSVSGRTPEWEENKGILTGKGGCRVTALIVDRNRNCRMRLKYLIRKREENCCVIVFSDGRQALDYAAGQEVDFLFVEVESRGINGFSLCRKVKGMQSQCYLTLMSEKGDYAYEAWMYGADNYLVKPFDGDRIGAILKDALLKRGYVEERI